MRRIGVEDVAAMVEAVDGDLRSLVGGDLRSLKDGDVR